MANFEYRLINVCDKDIEDYKKIHLELFPGSEIDNSWINWYHNEIRASDNRLSFTRTYGVYDNDRLIGIWSVEPKIMKNSDNELIKVGRCFAVGISSDYRRKGLFISLSQFAIERERERAEYEYILGFPQTGRSVIGGHLKSGWEEVSFVDIYSIDLEKNKGKFFRSDVKEIVDFSTLTTPLSSPNSFDEGSTYRNKRFLEHPKLHYLRYTHEDAHIILKPYSTFCHILEMKGSRENVIRLVEACKSICKKHGFIELNVWNNLNSLYHSVLVECGFSNGAQKGLPITIISVKIKAKKSLKLVSTFNFGMGVEEGY